MTGIERKLAVVVVASREHYLLFYRATLREYRTRFSPVATELMIEPNGSTTPVPFRYYRIDLAGGSVSSPNLTDVNGEPHALFEPVSFSLPSGLKVTLHPFVWSGVEFVTQSGPADISLLTEWVTRWLDLGDTKAQDGDGLSGVIHSVTFPRIEDGHWTFSVDFGSASTQSFDELLDTLAKLGIDKVSIGSFSYLGSKI